jgi:hypothetical protein
MSRPPPRRAHPVVDRYVVLQEDGGDLEALDHARITADLDNLLPVVIGSTKAFIPPPPPSAEKALSSPRNLRSAIVKPLGREPEPDIGDVEGLYVVHTLPDPRGD